MTSRPAPRSRASATAQRRASSDPSDPSTPTTILPAMALLLGALSPHAGRGWYPPARAERTARAVSMIGDPMVTCEPSPGLPAGGAGRVAGVHELSLCEAIAATVTRHAGERTASCVVVRIGHLRQV